MTYLFRIEKNGRSAQIEVVDEVLEAHFYEDTRYLGSIEYPEKTYAYVLDAAENWVSHVMTKKVLEMYKRNET